MTEMTEYQKMHSGAIYDSSDPEIQAMQAEGAARKAALDAVPETDFAARFAAMMALFGSMAGPSLVDPPFHVGFGRHIHLGMWVHLNTGCRLFDSAEIHIGDQTNIGPGSQLITLGHPKRPEDRFRPLGPDVPPFQIYSIAKPIHIGAQVWIGASVLVMPGVRIGDGAVIGAGAVVTRDVPARMVAVGNPARVVGSVDDEGGLNPTLRD